jgi:[NiFe] hydrogenase diaphorase moiety small subunit
MRCVREVFTNDGKAVFSFRHRGNETRVGIDYTEEARLSDRQAVDAMHLCPTGAIIVRGELHARPFGKRRFDLQSRQRTAPAEDPQIVLPKDKKTIATISLAGCFGCHMSLLDNDLKLLDLVELVELNKSPLNDIKKFTKHCDIGLIEAAAMPRTWRCYGSSGSIATCWSRSASAPSGVGCRPCATRSP